MYKRFTLSFLLVLNLLWPTTAEAAKLGKLFIKAAPAAEGQLAAPNLDDTVKDMKKRSGDFAIVTNESEADFLIVVLERKIVGEEKIIAATLSVRDGGAWKPATKLEDNHRTWKIAAGRVIDRAEKWVKANVRK